MIIRAQNNFIGKIDLSANPRLQEKSEIENLPFNLSMSPGQIVVADDKFYRLRSIQSALASGYITIEMGTDIYGFIDLTDVPDSYVGQNNKLVKVREDETGLDFTVRLTVGNIEPSNPSVNDLWVDTN